MLVKMKRQGDQFYRSLPYKHKVLMNVFTVLPAYLIGLNVLNATNFVALAIGLLVLIMGFSWVGNYIAYWVVKNTRKKL